MDTLLRALLLSLITTLLVYSKPFIVASYNVQNLFDMQKQGSEYSDYMPNTDSWNSDMLEMKLNSISEVICDLEADIIGLQEIENANALKLLSDRLEVVGCGYKYSAITHNKSSAIEVAILSRYPIISQNSISVSRYDRDILEAHIEIDGSEIRFFVNHWKSKANRGMESKRIKSAKRLQRCISQLPKGSEYILLGDFNSNYDEYQRLNDRFNDTNGKTAINDILQTKYNDRLVSEYDIANRDKSWHYNLWQELDIYDRWSYKFYGNKSSLDSIILSKEMFDGVGVDYVNNSFGVFKYSYLFTSKGYINRWKDGKGYSDHLPIYAKFDTQSYIKDVKDRPNNTEIKQKSIEYLYSIDRLDNPIILKDVIVILKRGRSAIVKQSIDGKGVYLFGCGSKLKEGYRYDLRVDGIKTYKGLKEITNLYILSKKQKQNIDLYYQKDILFIQNEIVKDIEGLYRDDFFYFGGNKIAIYFKDKKHKPKNNTKIKINFGHIGYYKKLNLVIYTKKDFEILE